MELRNVETLVGSPATVVPGLLTYVTSTTSGASSRAAKSSTAIGSSSISLCMVATIEDLSQTFPELPNSTKSSASNAEVASAQLRTCFCWSDVSNWKKYAVSLSDNFIRGAHLSRLAQQRTIAATESLPGRITGYSDVRFRAVIPRNFMPSGRRRTVEPLPSSRDPRRKPLPDVRRSRPARRFDSRALSHSDRAVVTQTGRMISLLRHARQGAAAVRRRFAALLGKLNRNFPKAVAKELARNPEQGAQ